MAHRTHSRRIGDQPDAPKATPSSTGCLDDVGDRLFEVHNHLEGAHADIPTFARFLSDV